MRTAEEAMQIWGARRLTDAHKGVLIDQSTVTITQDTDTYQGGYCGSCYYEETFAIVRISGHAKHDQHYLTMTIGDRDEPFSFQDWLEELFEAGAE